MGCFSKPVLDSVGDGLSEPRAVQLDALERRLAAGERLVGYKTALLGDASQRRMGAQGPAWGWLTDAMNLADGAQFNCDSQLRTRAEAEVVFVLGSDLVGPGVTQEDVMQATAAIRPGIELPGSQLVAAPASVAEFVADNAAAGRFILGGPDLDVPVQDLPLLGATLRRDGEVVSTGVGARVLGNPAAAVAWLANSLAYAGRELWAGMIVFTGAVAGPVDVTPGHKYSVDFAASVDFSARGGAGFTAV